MVMDTMDPVAQSKTALPSPFQGSSYFPLIVQPAQVCLAWGVSLGPGTWPLF